MSFIIAPSQNGTCRIEADSRNSDPKRVLDHSYELERQQKFDEACQARFDVAQPLADVLMQEENLEFDFTDGTTYAAAELLYDSAIDLLVAGEYEISAAMLELLLDHDSEDRFGCTVSAALCYIALGDEACFDEAILDVDVKGVDYPLLQIIENYRTVRTIPGEDLESLSRHREIVDELLAVDHPTDDKYISDINSEHPSRKAEARAVYLKYEPVIMMFDGLMDALREALGNLKRKTN